jgi:hypothetical protein
MRYDFKGRKRQREKEMIKPFKGACMYPDYPSKLKVELASGCSRSCEFCGIIRKGKPVVQMQTTLFKEMLAQFPDNLRAICYGISEPTLNENHIEMTAWARERFPDMRQSLITNGDLYSKKEKSLKSLVQLFEAGMDCVQYDLYDESAKTFFFEETRRHRAVLAESNISVVDFYTCGFNMETKPRQEGTHFLIYVDETEKLDSGHSAIRHFNTQGGAVPYSVWPQYGVDAASFPRRKTCAELLKYFTINATGKIPVCCAAHSVSTVVGDITKNSIHDIWISKKADWIRLLLKEGRRDAISDCYLCNRPSYRDALWPYWGKETSMNVSDIARILASDAEFGHADFVKNLQYVDDVYGLKNKYLKQRIERIGKNDRN